MKDLTINNERLYQEKAKIPKNSFEQHEKNRGVSSWGKTEDKSQRMAKLFKFETENKDEYGLNNLKTSPRKNYHTFKSTRSEYSLGTSSTAGQRRDYIFRNAVRSDRLNSYGG